MLLLSTGCDVTNPTNTEVDAPANARDAIAWVAAEWASRFDMTDYELPPVRWFSGDCLTWNLVSEPHDCTTGMYFKSSPVNDEQIELVIGRELWNTTIAHEFLHWTLQATRGDLDADHHDPRWAEVAEVEVGLCEYLNPGSTCAVAQPQPTAHR